MTKINFISGLGADERVFQYLDIPGVEKKYIRWIDPCKNESIEHYAGRLIGQFDPLKENVLICVSFGGLIGIELSKLCKFNKIIIISSVKNSYELPFYCRAAGTLHLYKIIPAFVLKSLTPILSYLFGITNINEKELLKIIIKDTDAKFLKWAISKITCWKNTVHLDNLYHIHGMADRLLPRKYVSSCIEIENGHHFMIVTKAGEVSRIINEILTKVNKLQQLPAL